MSNVIQFPTARVRELRAEIEELEIARDKLRADRPGPGEAWAMVQDAIDRRLADFDALNVCSPGGAAYPLHWDANDRTLFDDYMANGLKSPEKAIAAVEAAKEKLARTLANDQMQDAIDERRAAVPEGLWLELARMIIPPKGQG